MIKPCRIIFLLLSLSFFASCGLEDINEIEKVEDMKKVSVYEADAEASFVGNEASDQRDPDNNKGFSETLDAPNQDTAIRNIAGVSFSPEGGDAPNSAEDPEGDTHEDDTYDAHPTEEVAEEDLASAGVCHIVSRLQEGATEDDIHEFFNDAYSEHTTDEIVQLLMQCEDTSANIILIILIRKQTPTLDAVRAVLEQTGASIHLMIEVLKTELAESAIAEIISVLAGLGTYTYTQIGEILAASVESGVLIAEILYEELRNYAEILLTVVIKLGTPVYEAVAFVLEKAAYTAELVANVLIELATPIVEVVGVLTDLFFYTAIQIGEVLAATIQAGLTIADILYQELVEFAEILLVVVIKIGTPIFEAVSFVIEKAVYTAELVAQVLIKLASPIGEVVGVLANLFFFTAVQIAEVLAATVQSGLIIADILYQGLKGFAEVCLHVAIKLSATVVMAIQKVISIVGLTAQLVVKCLATIGLGVAEIVGTVLQFFAMAPLAILGLLSNHTNYHQQEITDGARIALADAGYDVYTVNSAINNFMQSGHQIGFSNHQTPSFGLSIGQ